MYRSKPRQVFPIVSWATVVLAVSAVGMQSLRSEVPRTGRNDLSDDPVPFRRAGWMQDIDWQRLTPENLREAERRERPILLLVGSTATNFSRDADRSYWTDPDVEFLANQFTCFRVDDQLRPDILPGVTPLSAASENRELGYGAIYLSEKRELIALYSVPRDRAGFSAVGIQNQLRTVLRLQGQGPGENWQQDDQEAQAAILRSPVDRRLPDFEVFRRMLLEGMDEASGAWPSATSIRPAPLEWSFLLDQGMPPAMLGAKIEPFLKSAMIDWVDGGVFARTTAPAWRSPIADRYALENANLMLFFARMYRATGQSIYREIANRTFDWLTGKMLFSGIVRPYSISDQDRLGRSRSRSASPRRMREIFSPGERESVRDLLTMRVEENSPMLPRLRRPFEPEDILRAQPFLDRIRETSPEPSGGVLDMGIRTPAVAGRVVARLRQSADLLGDESRGLKAEFLFGELAPFFDSEGRLQRTLDLLDASPATLVDALAMASVHFVDYKLTGNVFHANKAVDLFQAALDRYVDEDGGLVSLDKDAWGGLLDNFAVPDIRDQLGESPVAMATRLSLELALYLEAQGERSALASRFRSFAEDQASRYGAVVEQSPLGFTGLVSAAQFVAEDRAVLVIGPGAPQTASVIRRKFPSVLVLPIRRAGDGPGTPVRLVMMTQGQLSSPLSEEEGAEQISKWTPAK